MKIIPELRFPEFKNEGEWFGDTLINIAKFRRGSFPQPYGLPEWYDELNGMPFIQVYDVGDNFRLKPKTKSKISKLAAEQSVFIPKGTVIITIQGSIGRVAITQYDAYIDRTLLLFEEFYNEIDKTFFAYVLFMLFEIEKLKAPGGIIKTITKEVLSDFNINIPKLPEQQKIASCLSSLDEVIAAHSQKLELLKDHKKGLMQNLFPQEGETVPKYRFPEFEKDGEWVEKPLEKLTDKIGDGIHTTPTYDPTGDYYFINGNNLIDGKIIVEEKTKRVSTSEFEIHKKDLTEKTIFLSINGTIGNVAFYNNEKVVLGKSACYITPSKKLNTVFLYYSLQSPRINDYFNSELTGSTIKNLSLKSIRETAINLPSEIEQQKIASCLSSLDALITAQAEKIEQLQQHKKGLMQGLFPKIND